MGVIYFDPDDAPDQFHELPAEAQKAARSTLEACGASRFGNWSVQGVSDDGAEVRVKVQLGSGESLDLSDRRVTDRGTPSDEFDHDYEVWHYNGMLGSGRVEGLHQNGYVMLSVMARY